MVPTEAVCGGHCSPMDFLESWCYEPPSLSLVLGPRGGGKSYLSAFHTHFESLCLPNLGTRILGGSMAQSEQIYNALRDMRTGPDSMVRLTREQAEYRTGSTVAILAATAKSVRGPHVARLKLDEVDEIEPDTRDAAMGMSMARNGVPGAVMMTSTWHNVAGPMGQLVDRALGGDFPLYTFCAFEVLERCPEERSGPGLERCPECPIVEWCHADRDSRPDGLPKAKRSDGHYAIDSLTQKARIVSRRVFEADYLCGGPKADGLWFKEFDPNRHVTEAGEYDPALRVYLAVDVGVFTGAVFFQLPEVGKVTLRDGRTVPLRACRVFADYLAEDVSARENARALKRLAEERCEGRIDIVYGDPAGDSRNAVGPTVAAEYRAEGMHLRPWPKANVADSLELLDGFVNPAGGGQRLFVHPRCRWLAKSFASYRRARRQGQWMDYPEDPQHFAEDLIDALRGGLYAIQHAPVLRIG